MAIICTFAGKGIIFMIKPSRNNAKINSTMKKFQKNMQLWMICPLGLNTNF